MLHRRIFFALSKKVFFVLFLRIGLRVYVCGSPKIASRKVLVVATVSQGHIVGQQVPEGGIFWGIPYSQPPVGSYRWKNPTEPLPFKGKYWNATYARPGCPQYCHNSHHKFTCPAVTSEDCLYLNIWVPKRLLKKSYFEAVVKESHYTVADKFTKSDSDSLAVMFYLHGGNFKFGAGSTPLYDSRFLAQRGDVVVVTTNYRLGALGFLVQGSGNDSAVGNYGILDQIEALNWVKKNINNFGGNPKRITIFGQSAGAESVGVLMTSPRGKGLFQRAIFESDPSTLPFHSMRSARVFGDKFARKAGCKVGNMTCLRNLSADQIVLAARSTKASLFGLGNALFAFQPWGPVIDGKLLLDLPINSFRKGNYHQIPVIIGDDRSDAYLFVDAALKGKISSFMYLLYTNFIFGVHANAVLKQYPPCSGDNKMTMSRLATDFMFICPARAVLFSMGLRSWFYIFDATIRFKSLWGNNVCTVRACHGSELPYVFNTLLLTKYRFTRGENDLSNKIVLYWTNFAKYGNPNGKGGENHTKVERWNRFLDFQNREYKALEMTTHGNIIRSNPYEEKCDFWDKLDLYGKL